MDEAYLAALPQEVATFIERRALCDHFRAEEPYDAERKAFLHKNIVELCTGSDRELARLKEQYADNPEIMQRFAEYEVDIEPNR